MKYFKLLNKNLFWMFVAGVLPKAVGVISVPFFGLYLSYSDFSMVNKLNFLIASTSSFYLLGVNTRLGIGVFQDKKEPGWLFESITFCSLLFILFSPLILYINLVIPTFDSLVMKYYIFLIYFTIINILIGTFIRFYFVGIMPFAIFTTVFPILTFTVQSLVITFYDNSFVAKTNAMSIVMALWCLASTLYVTQLNTQYISFKFSRLATLAHVSLKHAIHVITTFLFSNLDKIFLLAISIEADFSSYYVSSLFGSLGLLYVTIMNMFFPKELYTKMSDIRRTANGRQDDLYQTALPIIAGYLAFTTIIYSCTYIYAAAFEHLNLSMNVVLTLLIANFFVLLSSMLREFLYLKDMFLHNSLVGLAAINIWLIPFIYLYSYGMIQTIHFEYIYLSLSVTEFICILIFMIYWIRLKGFRS